MKGTAGGEKVAFIIKRCQVKPAASDASTVVFVNDRKITADGKEGPGDRSGSPYLATRPQKPGYDGGTAQPAHDAEAT
nr:hypothetical protein [Escherichia coli]